MPPNAPNIVAGHGVAESFSPQTIRRSTAHTTPVSPVRSCSRRCGRWRASSGTLTIPMGPPRDLIDLLTAFAAERVEYLLVGGLALAEHVREA